MYDLNAEIQGILDKVFWKDSDLKVPENITKIGDVTINHQSDEEAKQEEIRFNEFKQKYAETDSSDPIMVALHKLMKRVANLDFKFGVDEEENIAFETLEQVYESMKYFPIFDETDSLDVHVTHILEETTVSVNGKSIQFGICTECYAKELQEWQRENNRKAHIKNVKNEE